MANLDKSRDFATVHGIESGAVYSQDGKYFDAAGVEVGDTPESAPEVKAASKAKVKAAIDEVNSLV